MGSGIHSSVLARLEKAAGLEVPVPKSHGPATPWMSLGCPWDALGCPRMPWDVLGCPLDPLGCPRMSFGCPRMP